MIDRLKAIPAEFTLPVPHPSIEDLEQENRLMRARNERLEAVNAEILALLIDLVDTEGPQPGTSAWGDKARAAIAKAETN